MNLNTAIIYITKAEFEFFNLGYKKDTDNAYEIYYGNMGDGPKKRGVKCIGCPVESCGGIGGCSGNCGGNCGGSCHKREE